MGSGGNLSRNPQRCPHVSPRPSTPFHPPARTRHAAPGERGLLAESGFALMELLAALVVGIVLMSATFAALNSTTKAQIRDQAYAQEVTATQTALARMVHDLREATEIRVRDAVQGRVPDAADRRQTYTVLYDCTASDTLGSGYTRCARTQTTSGSLPAAGSKPGTEDVQHIYNNAAQRLLDLLQRQWDRALRRSVPSLEPQLREHGRQLGGV